MLSVYTNQKELLKASSTSKVSRLESVDTGLLDVRNYSVTFKQGIQPNLEMHVYTPDGVYLTGNHNTLYSVENNNSALTAYQHLSINSVTELETLGIIRGQYRLVYNLFDNVLGAYDKQKAWIKEISPSRRELRIQLADNSNIELLQQLFTLRDRWESLSQNDIFDSFVLNFGFNETYQIVNFRFEIEFTDTPELIIKLYNPLPAKYGEKSKIWISEEIINPILDVVSIVPKHIPEPVNTLSGPNFELETEDGNSVATDFKSWNDLLATNISTSQQLIDSQFSGSLSGVKLNINYRLFDNFIHYGSAVERVKNFKYKLELIEYYSNQSNTLNSVNGGSAVNTNLADVYTKRNAVVSSFDDFEKYLFFESTGSKLYTHYDSGTGSIDPWPKTTPTALTWTAAYTLWSTYSTQWTVAANPDPYEYFAIQVATDSGTGESYYSDLLEIAEIYDKFNVHKLQNTIPLHIQDSDDSEEFLLFVNMLAQHFDILWTYVNGLSSIHTREEHPKDGMSEDLLYRVATSLGFNLLNGRSASDLWKYSLGVDANGNTLQSDVGGITTLSDSANTKEIWRRIVNNLPYILKTKGTSRSVKALLSCFGIPASVLTIKEYGGPSTFTDNDHYPEYVHDVYHYAWYSSSTGSLYIPSKVYLNTLGANVYPNSLEFRFKTDNNFSYNSGSAYTILSTPSSLLSLTKETSNDNQGTLTYYDISNATEVSIGNLEIFDNSWQQVSIDFIQEPGAVDGSINLRVAKSLYGKQIYLHSASLATLAGFNPFEENLSIASGSSKLYGHFHELRLWSGSLNDNSLLEHAASPATYTYNSDRVTLTAGSEASKPYDHLLQRFTLANKVILSGSLYQPSVHPNQTINTGSLYFIGFANSGSIAFEGFEETYYTPSPSIGGSSLYTNKVRIESSSLDANVRLNTKTRVEKSSFDRYSIDSNRVGIYFSPQTAINEDIFNQLGYFEIDDYIGNPGDLYNDTYRDLNNFAISYWKKYENRNDFEAYFRALEIYDFTMFKYIKKLLPQRANAVVGLVIEPNVLERSKVKLINKPTIENLTKEANIEKYEPTLNSEFQQLEGLIEVYTNPIEVNIDTNKLGVINYNVSLEESTFSSNSGTIEGAINVDRLGDTWVQNRFIGKYKLTESGSYNVLQTTVFNSRVSTYLLTADEYFYSSSLSASLNKFYSSSLKFAEVNNFYGTGNENAKWNGSKLTGPGININSANTVDGGPVVKTTKVNPNTIVFANNQITTIDKAVTGIKTKSI